jgi:hypothetical protein
VGGWWVEVDGCEDEARRSTISRDLIQHDHPSSLRPDSPSNTIFAVGRRSADLCLVAGKIAVITLYEFAKKVVEGLKGYSCCGRTACSARVAFTFTVTITHRLHNLTISASYCWRRLVIYKMRVPHTRDIDHASIFEHLRTRGFISESQTYLYMIGPHYGVEADD